MTATESSEKSRDALLATLITRTRKLELAKLAALHVLPHGSMSLPRTWSAWAVVSVVVIFGEVHEAPPSADSWTHIFGLPHVPLLAAALLLTPEPARAASAA